MNNQFATQFLLEDYDELESLKSALQQAGASEDAAAMLVTAVRNGHLEPSAAVQIIKDTTGLSEDGMGGGSTTGGGVTNGASFTAGAGEQYASTRAFKKKMKESASESATAAKLVLQAKKDGYIAGDYSQAVLSAAKKVGSKFDELQPEEQRAMRDRYYDLFLQAANLKKPGVQEDAPMLAAGKADISTYTQDGFKKTEGHPKLKSIEPKDLWDTLPTAMSEELEETILKATKEKLDGILGVIKDKNPKIYDYILDLITDIYPHDDEVEALVAKASIQEIGLDSLTEPINEGLGNEIGDTVYFRGDIGEKYPTSQGYYGVIEDVIPARNYNMMAIYQVVVYDKNGNEIRTVKGDWTNFTSKKSINENYNRFKKETKIRPKQDQYHEAIKAVNKKLDEVNRILEFTTRMKEELSEGEETLEVKSRTAKTMDKLKTKIAEAYKKLKHLN